MIGLGSNQERGNTQDLEQGKFNGENPLTMIPDQDNKGISYEVKTLKNIGIAYIMEQSPALGIRLTPSRDLFLLRIEILTLLRRTKLCLTGWQRNHYGTAPGELVGNVPPGTCQKSNFLGF